MSSIGMMILNRPSYGQQQSGYDSPPWGGKKPMRIAVIGTDVVGRALGMALAGQGHAVVYGIPEPERSDERNVRSVREAIDRSEVVILATP